jgi:DNA-binding GntR family transcriptional regulator
VPSTVYERLREDIVAGTFAAGQPLVETALAAQYGTSRTPVREALRSLQQDGLIERGDRGMRVRNPSPEEILEIYEVRIVLETAAARAAAERRTSYDVLRLRQAHEAMHAIEPDDGNRMAESNRHFHEAIWTASHNATLIDLLARLNSHLVRYPTTTLTHPGRWEEVLDEHARLIAAIESRDDAASAEIAERHMTAARDTRLHMYVGQPSASAH